MSLQENNTQLGQDEEDIRMELYWQYATPEQSLEDFCDAAADHLGPNWIELLNRK